MLNNIWFNGVSARDMGVRGVEKYPDLNRPERKVDVFDVPGRSGSIIFPSDAWENIEREYEIFAGGGTRGTVAAPFNSIAEWLNSPGGYAKLEDTYEPEVFRLAYCTGGMETENAYTRLGRATIVFNCRPERFLKSGAEGILFKSTGSALSGTIANPTGYPARPLIELVKAGNASNTTLTVTSGAKTYPIGVSMQNANIPTYIDCEAMDCYTSTANVNSWFSIPEFPVLEPHTETTFTIGAGYDVTITPRWYYI